MAITVGGTTITFNDGTTQSTAATGYTPSYLGVGSVVVAVSSTYFSGNANRNAGLTAAGSTLKIPNGYVQNPGMNTWYWNGNTISLGATGTWVACTRFYSSSEQVGYNYEAGTRTTIWMRIA